LKDHRPGNDGENTQQNQNASGHPARLGKNIAQVGDKQRGEQRNDATPQLRITAEPTPITKIREKFPTLETVAHAYRVVKTNQMQKRKKMLPFWERTNSMRRRARVR
jgi:hypothetical protein